MINAETHPVNPYPNGFIAPCRASGLLVLQWQNSSCGEVHLHLAIWQTAGFPFPSTSFPRVFPHPRLARGTPSAGGWSCSWRQSSREPPGLHPLHGFGFGLQGMQCTRRLLQQHLPQPQGTPTARAQPLSAEPCQHLLGQRGLSREQGLLGCGLLQHLHTPQPSDLQSLLPSSRHGAQL